MTTMQLHRFVAVAVISAVVVALAGLSARSGALADGGSVVSLHPAKTNVSVGETVAVGVSVTNVVNLAGYDLMLQYDDSVLEFVRFTNASFLASTGRLPFCLSPVLDDLQNTVQDGCASANPSPAGPSGDGELGTFTFKAVGNGQSQLLFRKIELSTPDGNDAGILEAVGETAIAVGEQPAPAAGTPTPPPTPRPDSARLTPTRPANVTPDNTYRLDTASSAPAPTETSGGGASLGASGQVAGSRQGGTGSAGTTSEGGEQRGSGFPRSGYGPDAEPQPWQYRFGILLGLAGAAVLLAGVSRLLRTMTR